MAYANNPTGTNFYSSFAFFLLFLLHHRRCCFYIICSISVVNTAICCGFFLFSAKYQIKTTASSPMLCRLVWFSTRRCTTNYKLTIKLYDRAVECFNTTSSSFTIIIEHWTFIQWIKLIVSQKMDTYYMVYAYARIKALGFYTIFHW